MVFPDAARYSEGDRDQTTIPDPSGNRIPRKLNYGHRHEHAHHGASAFRIFGWDESW